MGDTSCNLGTHLEFCTEDQHIISSCGLGFLTAQILEHPKRTRSNLKNNIVSLISYLQAYLNKKEDNIDPPGDRSISIFSTWIWYDMIWYERNYCGYSLKMLSATFFFLVIWMNTHKSKIGRIPHSWLTLVSDMHWKNTSLNYKTANLWVLVFLLSLLLLQHWVLWDLHKTKKIWKREIKCQSSAEV